MTSALMLSACQTTNSAACDVLRKMGMKRATMEYLLKNDTRLADMILANNELGEKLRCFAPYR